MLNDLKFVFTNLLQRVIQLFPLSPFRGIIDQITSLPYLGWLNWFMPVSEIITVVNLWIAAIVAYYLYMVVARWIKLVS